MKTRLTPLVSALCLLGLVSTPVFAASNSMNNNIEQQMEKISAQSQQLQSEVKSLKAEVRQLKNEQKSLQRQKSRPTPGKGVSQPHGEYFYKHIDGTPVITAPHFGTRTNFNGSDLVTNIPSVNSDLAILKKREALDKKLDAKNTPLEQPILELSGQLVGAASWTKPFAGASTSDINLTGSDINLLITTNPWLTGYIDIAYDDSPNGGGTLIRATRTQNSRLFINQGFVTVGNLSKSPFYATLGQEYVPFGQFSTNMISDPVTKLLGRTKARAIVGGFKTHGKNHLNGSVYLFRGDSVPSGVPKANQYGANLAFNHEGDVNYKVGLSYISNIAQSSTLQNNGATTGFMGFGATALTESIAHNVPGIDAYGSVNIGPFDILAEYTGTTRAFTFTNLRFDGNGARLRAAHIEGAYTFDIGNKPSSVAISAGETWEALALNLPKNRYMAAFNTSIWKDSVESVELRHDVNYKNGSTAGGNGGNFIASGLGNSSNAVTFQLAQYF